MRKRREIHAEERALWHHVTRHVKPLRAPRPKPKAKLDAAPVAEAATTPRHPPKQVKPAKPANTITPVARAGVPAAPAMDLTSLDGARAKKLKRGDLPIEDRIDLHGATETLAHRRLEEFVARASQAGLRVVLVITGKGKGGRGLLRELVPRWLKEPGLRRQVVAMAPAAQRHGGDGALYLYLRRRARLAP